MRNLRITKAMKLRIGEKGPNILIPVMYGSIERVLQKKAEGDLDKILVNVCKENKIPEATLSMLLEKYKSLPHQVKRRWSGEEYNRLMTINSVKEAAKAFMKVENEIKMISAYKRYIGIKELPRKATAPGLQPALPKPKIKSCCCCNYCCDEKPYEPETPTTTSPEEPPKNRYMWELGPSLHCYDPYEDWLGDDLYAVYAWGDGAGEFKLDTIPKTDGTNDLDAGENGTWPFPQRVIYPAKSPKGYLHIEIDIWEKDYSAEFFSGLLNILSAIAGPIGTAIGGATGGAIGSLVGKGLEAARSQISANDDDNYLGKLEFDYPQGEANLHTLVGPQGVDWTSSTEDGVHYKFNYNINELAP